MLFLPGNAGSHMQARSLASVALRKALSKGNDFHLDFFTSKIIMYLIHKTTIVVPAKNDLRLHINLLLLVQCL